MTIANKRRYILGAHHGPMGYLLLVSTLSYFVMAPQSANAAKNADSEARHRTDSTQVENRLDLLDQRLEEQNSRIAELEQTIARQQEMIDIQVNNLSNAKVETQRLRIAFAELGEWEVIDRTNGASSWPRRAHANIPAVRSTFASQPTESTGSAEDPVTSPDEQPVTSQGERPQSDKAVDQLLVDQGGVLLPAGVLQIEPSIDYTSISSDRVNISGFSIFNAILIGTIRVDDINRDILTGAVTARYGLGSRAQVDVRVPYIYRNDTETTGIGTGDAQERSTSGSGLGDIGLTIAWQPLSAKGGRPAVILRLQSEFPTGKSAFEIERVAPAEDSPERILVEAPTGSGFYTFSPGVTMVWPIDPVVLFAGGAYSYTFGRHFPEFGLVEPGNGFEFFAGMNMSINERVSMNFSFLDKQRFSTSVGGAQIPGSGTHDARLSLGASVGLTDKTSLVFSAATGLTDESPDFSFSVRLPIVF